MLNLKSTLIIVLVSFALTACAKNTFTRPDYKGADQVGEIDASTLIGTWQVTNLNPRAKEAEIDAQYAFKADGTATGYTIADHKNEAGIAKFETAGVWSVRGDKIIQKYTDVVETTGNPFVVFGMALNLDLRSGQETVANLYEVSANRLVIVNETNGVAQRFDRVQ